MGLVKLKETLMKIIAELAFTAVLIVAVVVIVSELWSHRHRILDILVGHD